MSDTEKILQMISDEKISVEDGERLLRAIKGQSKPKANRELTPKESIKQREGSQEGGKVVIDIQSSDGEHVKFNVPLKLAQFAIGMLPKDKLSTFQANGVDFGKIFENFPDALEGMEGDIVDITTESGDRFRVFVED